MFDTTRTNLALPSRHTELRSTVAAYGVMYAVIFGVWALLDYFTDVPHLTIHSSLFQVLFITAFLRAFVGVSRLDEYARTVVENIRATHDIEVPKSAVKWLVFGKMKSFSSGEDTYHLEVTPIRAEIVIVREPVPFDDAEEQSVDPADLIDLPGEF